MHHRMGFEVHGVFMQIGDILLRSNFWISLIFVLGCQKKWPAQLPDESLVKRSTPNQVELSPNETPSVFNDTGKGDTSGIAANDKSNEQSPPAPASSPAAPQPAASSTVQPAATASPTPTSPSPVPSSTAMTPSAPGATSTTPVANAPKVVIAELSPGQSQTLLFDELGKPKRKSYNLKVCLEEGVRRVRMPLTDIRVSDSFTIKELKTDNAGCTVWQESYEFDYWAPETFYEIKRYINVPKESTTVLISYLFNPWTDAVIFQPLDKATAANQLVTATKAKIVKFDGELIPFQSEPARLTLDSIQLKFNGMDFSKFEVDRYLSLKVAQRYFVEFRPWAVRRKLNDPNGNESIPQGSVRLKILFLKDTESNRDLSDFRNYITSIDETFQIDRDYQNVKKVTYFKFPDISALSTRMRVLVKISLNTSSKSLGAGYFEGFIESLPGDNIQLNKTKYDFDTIDKKFSAELKKLEASPSPTQLLSSQGKVKPLANSDFYLNKNATYGNYLCSGYSSTKINKNLLDKMLSSGFSSLTACEKIALKSELAAKYHNYYPQFGFRSFKFQSFGTFYLVEKVIDPHPQLSDLSKISLSSQLSVNLVMSESISTSRETKASAGASLSANAGMNLDLLGLSGMSLPAGATAKGLGASASVNANVRAGVEGSWTYGWMKGASRTQSLVQNINLESRKRTFKISAVVRKCIISVFELPTEYTLPENWVLRDMSRPIGFSYCAKQTQPLNFEESYYYITDNLGRSDAWSDGKSIDQRTLVMFVRGDRKFDLMKEIFERKDYMLQFSGFDMGKNAYTVPPATYERVTQVFPGLVSQPALR